MSNSIGGHRYTPPPAHHTQAAATPQHAAPAQHAATPGQTAGAAGTPHSKHADGGKEAQQPGYSGNMKGPTPGPKQPPGNKAGGTAKGGGKGGGTSSVGRSRSRGRRAPISGEDENSWGDEPVEEADAAASGVGGGEMGDARGGDQGGKGGGEQSKQDQKSKQGGLEHSRNMGNYSAGHYVAGHAGKVKFAAKPLTGPALIRREVVLLETSVKELAKIVTAPVKPQEGKTTTEVWRTRIGEVKKLGLKVSRELNKLGITHFDNEQMPSTKDLILKFFPKPDRSLGPPSEEQAGLNRMVWMIVHTLRRTRTPKQFKLNAAHHRVRYKQRNRIPSHG